MLKQIFGVFALVMFVAVGEARAQNPVLNFSGDCRDEKTTTAAQGPVGSQCAGRMDVWVSKNSWWTKWKILRAAAWTQSFVCPQYFTEHLSYVYRPGELSSMNWEESIKASDDAGTYDYVQKMIGFVTADGPNSTIIRVFSSSRCRT